MSSLLVASMTSMSAFLAAEGDFVTLGILQAEHLEWILLNQLSML